MSVFPSNPNRIVNGNFETDYSGWILGTGTTAEIVSGGASGNCLKGYGWFIFNGAVQTSSAEVGENYCLSFYAKKGMAIGLVQVTNGGLFTDDFNLNVTTWTAFNYCFTAVASLVSVEWFIDGTWAAGAGAYSYLDSVNLYKVQTAVVPEGIYTANGPSWNKIDDLRPLHHWKLNELSGSTIAQDSGSSPIVGSSVSTPLCSMTGYVQNAWQFTGTAYIDSNYTPAKTNKSQFCWVKFTTITVASEQMVAGVSESNSWFYMGVGSHGSIYTYAGGVGGSLSTVLVKDVWYHLGVVLNYNNDSHEIFLNASQVGIRNTLVAETQSTAVFTIGKQSAGYASQAFIEDVRVYDRALTQQEISAIYNEGKGTYADSYRRGFPTALDPIYHWKLNDITTGTVNNSGTTPIAASLAAGWLSQPANIPNSVALRFTGTSACYIAIPDNVLTITTVCMWFKRLGAAGGGSNHPLITWLNSVHQGIQIWVGSATNTAGVFTTANHSFTVADSDLNYWHHYAVVLNSLTCNGYFDGITALSKTVVRASTTASTLTTRIGYHGSDFCYGDMQDVRVYNYALSAEEVLNLYNEGRGTLL